ncbi:uncharacterized protein LOC144879032 isoform X2 [Branchiostoma floridae x Branchiostoma japonicum]
MCRLAAVLAACVALVRLTTALQACSSSFGSRIPRWTEPRTHGVCICSAGRVDCANKNLAVVPDNIPASTTYLRLQNNKISSIRDGKFQRLESLTVLCLNNNQIDVIRSLTFVGLPNLETLYLQNNNIGVVEPGSFQDLQELNTLNLAHNKLTTLHRDTFATSYTLNVLLLEHNQITTLSYDIFDSLGRFPVDNPLIRLNGNPWSCDCRLQEAISLGWSQQVVCHSPPSLNGKRLSSLVPDQLTCPWTTATPTVGIPASTTAPSTTATSERSGDKPESAQVPAWITSVTIGCGVCGLNLCSIVGIVCYMRRQINSSSGSRSQQEAVNPGTENPSQEANEDEIEYEDVLLPDRMGGGNVHYAEMATADQTYYWGGSSHTYENIRSEDEYEEPIRG